MAEPSSGPRGEAENAGAQYPQGPLPEGEAKRLRAQPGATRSGALPVPPPSRRRRVGVWLAPPNGHIALDFSDKLAYTLSKRFPQSANQAKTSGDSVMRPVPKTNRTTDPILI